MKAQEVDTNQALQSLDVKKDCEVTFKDIWIDYKNFKSAYYYEQRMNPTEKIKEPQYQVEVPIEKFNLRQTLWNAFFYGNKHEREFSATWTFS